MWWTIIVTTLLLPSAIYGKSVCHTQLDKDVRSTKIYLDVFKFSLPKRTKEPPSPELPHGGVVNFECQTGFVRKDLPDTKYPFKCVNGKFNESYPLEEILCRSDFHKNSMAVLVKPKDFNSKIFKCDSPDFELYKMHSMQLDGKRKHIYTVCLDSKVMRAKFAMQPSTAEKPPSSLFFEERNDIWGFDGYGKSVKEMLTISKGYVENIQKTRMTNSFPQKYSSSKPFPYYFNRGHLVPYADFAEEVDRKATCEYLNAAPQWDAFNKNSWSLVEREVRSLRQENPKEWEVYTGTYGSIPTSRGPLFAAPIFEQGKFKKGLLPVPMIYWKLAHNIVDKTKSRAYVGINNPEIRSPDQIVDKYKLCSPLALPMKSPIEGSEFFGFVYRCNVDDFLKALKKTENVIKDNYAL